MKSIPLKGEGQSVDHAPPKKWYPVDATSQRATAPSCPECNASLSEIEDTLRLLALRTPPNSRAVAGPHEAERRALRSGKSKPQRSEVLSRAFVSDGSRDRQALPGYGPSSDATIGLPIPRFFLSRFGEKMVRVLSYRRLGHYIEPPLAVFPADPVIYSPARLRTMPGVQVYEHGPGMLSITASCALLGARFWSFRLFELLQISAVEASPGAVRAFAMPGTLIEAKPVGLR